MYRLAARPPRTVCLLPSRLRLRLHLQKRSSSGSPSPTGVPPGHFNKTGEREASDPTKINMRSDEYSKSGGDDIVAEQTIASFKSAKDTDPASQKETAGRGNTVNPLEVSPASPEVSRYFEETYVEKNVERKPGVHSGPGISRKAKKVEKLEMDFDLSKIKMKGR